MADGEVVLLARSERGRGAALLGDLEREAHLPPAAVGHDDRARHVAGLHGPRHDLQVRVPVLRLLHDLVARDAVGVRMRAAVVDGSADHDEAQGDQPHQHEEAVRVPPIHSLHLNFSWLKLRPLMVRPKPLQHHERAFTYF